jgi:hypothetical protein
VAGVLLAAADKLGAGLLHRFHAQWAAEEFTVVRISIERIRSLYMYSKKGDEGEHYLASSQAMLRLRCHVSIQHPALDWSSLTACGL